MFVLFSFIHSFIILISIGVLVIKDIATLESDEGLRLADVTLQADDGAQVQAHRVVLCLSSAYFCTVLLKQPLPNLVHVQGITSVAVLKEVTLNVLYLVVVVFFFIFISFSSFIGTSFYLF